MLSRLLLVGLLLGLGASARAGEKASEPLARKDLDKRITNVLTDAINTGAPVFNAGDQAGCYRLYQGSLMALTPLLDHRPDLQEKVKKGLERATSLRTSADRAFALRAVMDDVLAALEKDAPVVAQKSLWDRLGGEPAVRAVVHDFVLMAARDPKVNFDRGGRFQFDDKAVARLEQLLVELVSTVSGGPLKYTGRDMKSTHAGMKITGAEFNALAADLKAALDKFKVPKAEQEELFKIIETTRGDIVEKK